MSFIQRIHCIKVSNKSILDDILFTALRLRRARTKKRVHYAILGHKNNEGYRMMQSHRGLEYRQTDFMLSDTETEEEILYDSSTKGGSKNGNVPSTSVDIKKNHSKTPNGRSPGQSNPLLKS